MPSSVETGNYTVIATSSAGCKDTAVVTIGNYPATTPVYTISNATATSYTLTSTNIYGCKDTATVVISSLDCAESGTLSNAKNVELFSNKQVFTLLPNPAQSQVYIKGSNLKDIRITDSRGKLVLTKTVADGRLSTQTMLNLQGFAKGFYMVLLTDNDGNKQTEKLVVQ
eukprot:gene28890-38205_t